MAVNTRERGRWWSRLHFVIRLLGLTGLVVGGAAAAYLYCDAMSWEALRPALQPADWLGLGVALALLVYGGLAAAAALLVELVSALALTAGRRSAFGGNALLQVGLVLALVVAANVFSFHHYLRFDWTRKGDFTLPDDVQRQLRQLKEPTKVVVFQRQKTFGTLSPKPDAYDFAAGRQVVDRVKDLVEQLQEFGTQFRVEVLDAEEEGYTDKLARATEDAPELRRAITRAPDNSIFFYAKDDQGRARVQRLSFEEFYQLDKVESEEQKNLVLYRQGKGVAPFARKVLNIEEKKPRVAVAVNWEVLTTEGPEELGLRGLRQALERHGFEVRDVVLRRAGFQPAAYTYQESRYNTLEGRLANMDKSLNRIDRLLAKFGPLVAPAEGGGAEAVNALARFLALRTALDQLGAAVLDKEPADIDRVTRAYAAQLRALPAETRAEMLKDLKEEVESLRQMREQVKALRDRRSKERDELDSEALEERRRQADVKAKLKAQLEDCDLLIIPRLTIVDLALEWYYTNDLHEWDRQQVDALRDFLKAGKPVLACFGPTNTPRPVEGQPAPDSVEELLAQLGLGFGKETVLYDVEAEALAARQGRQQRLEIPEMPEKVPAVRFEPDGSAAKGKAHPIALDLQRAARSVGAERGEERNKDKEEGKKSDGGPGLDVQIRYPRLLTFKPPRWAPKGGSQAAGVVKAAGKDAADAAPAGDVKKEAGDDDRAAAKREGWTPAELNQLRGVAALAWSQAHTGGTALHSAGLALWSPEEPRGLAVKDAEAPELRAEFMLTTDKAWKEDQPFGTSDRMLLAGAGKRGPFAVGVAAEVAVPLDWYGDTYPLPADRTVRVAAVGHGGWFVGKELAPAKQKLLVDTCNWLVRRDVSFTQVNDPQSFPRLNLDTRAKWRWRLGMAVGLPALFVYLGLVVLLARRLR